MKYEEIEVVKRMRNVLKRVTATEFFWALPLHLDQAFSSTGRVPLHLAKMKFQVSQPLSQTLLGKKVSATSMTSIFPKMYFDVFWYMIWYSKFRQSHFRNTFNAENRTPSFKRQAS